VEPVKQKAYHAWNTKQGCNVVWYWIYDGDAMEKLGFSVVFPSEFLLERKQTSVR
jgi:hypothetical protein